MEPREEIEEIFYWAEHFIERFGMIPEDAYAIAEELVLEEVGK